MKVTEKNFRSYRSFALITGAAGGMGALYAERLAMLGYNLVLVDIKEDGLEKVAAQVREKVASLNDWRASSKDSFRVLTLAQDLSLMDAAETIKARTDAEGIEVEVLVNNAGMLIASGIVRTNERRLKLIMMVHCTTPMLLCRAYVPEMQARHNGYVLNVSSLAAWMPWPCIGMYSGTKLFVRSFSRSLRIECRKTGVSVTNAYFGAVDTPLVPLAPNLKKIARSLGVMIKPERAVECALDATFKRRKGTMPGFINKVARVFCPIIPENFLGWVFRKYGHIFDNI
ncbi:MAG: SDR family NAD(P)-dependent oxidoreductase [Bacteroidales bacterium]|nr:SDR family NAD(P)-dependent oxidoreductase [Candidatus Cryptobacteroides caccocaballi]